MLIMVASAPLATSTELLALTSSDFSAVTAPSSVTEASLEITATAASRSKGLSMPTISRA